MQSKILRVILILIISEHGQYNKKSMIKMYDKKYDKYLFNTFEQTKSVL